MPTYEYECRRCNARFERQQSMSDEPVRECPSCGGEARRVISGGAGFVMKAGSAPRGKGGSCSLESTGKTCCGRDQRCGKSPCEG